MSSWINLDLSNSSQCYILHTAQTPFVFRWILTSLGIPAPLIVVKDYSEAGFRRICVVCLKSQQRGVYHPLGGLRWARSGDLAGIKQGKCVENASARRFWWWLTVNRQAVIIRWWKKPKRARSLSMAFQCCVWLKQYLHSLTKYAANSDVERKTMKWGAAGIPLWILTCNNSQEQAMVGIYFH